MDRKKKQELDDMVGLICEKAGFKPTPQTIEEISDFAAAKLENPLPGGENPYREGQINRTKQVIMERENPELAKALQEQAKRGL